VHRNWKSPLALLLLLAGVGCGGANRYVNPNSDLTVVRRVAIVPFENVTQDKLSGEKVQRIFLTEVLSLGAFEVVEPGQVLKALRAERLEAASLTAEDIKRLGKALDAQGLFLGTVVEFEENRSGAVPTPQVTVQLRLVETESAATVWSVSRTRGGATVTARLFGVGGKSATSVAEELIREELLALTE
jgi:TolB-like protein